MSTEHQSEKRGLRNRHITKAEAIQAAKFGVVIGGVGGVIYSTAMVNAPAAVASFLVEYSIAGPAVAKGVREMGQNNNNQA